LNEDTCYYAATSGHLDCLKWAKDNDCSFNWKSCFLNSTSLEIDQWLTEISPTIDNIKTGCYDNYHLLFDNYKVVILKQVLHILSNTQSFVKNIKFKLLQPNQKLLM